MHCVVLQDMEALHLPLGLVELLQMHKGLLELDLQLLQVDLQHQLQGSLQHPGLAPAALQLPVHLEHRAVQLHLHLQTMT